jgi:hypothetical protein
VPHEAEGQLLVTSGSVKLSFTDIEGEGVGVFVVWDLKPPSSRPCRLAQTSCLFFKIALGVKTLCLKTGGIKSKRR